MGYGYDSLTAASFKAVIYLMVLIQRKSKCKEAIDQNSGSNSDIIVISLLSGSRPSSNNFKATLSFRERPYI